MSDLPNTPLLPLVDDCGVYVLNPYFRLRNEDGFVLLYGDQGCGTFRLPRSFGVVLALCNGKRTVEDIAKITTPFTDDLDFVASLRHCKRIISWMTLSRQEQQSMPSAYSPRPSDAPLILKREYGEKFLQPFEQSITYDVRKFLSNGSFASGKPIYQYRDSSPLSVQWHLTSNCFADCCLLLSAEKGRLSFAKRAGT